VGSKGHSGSGVLGKAEVSIQLVSPTSGEEAEGFDLQMKIYPFPFN
jgi:hypothetical protein